MFVHQDGGEHLDFRRPIAHEFSVLRTRRLAGRISGMARERLKVMTGHGSPADLVTDYALPLCSQAVCELLGVPWPAAPSSDPTGDCCSWPGA